MSSSDARTRPFELFGAWAPSSAVVTLNRTVKPQRILAVISTTTHPPLSLLHDRLETCGESYRSFAESRGRGSGVAGSGVLNPEPDSLRTASPRTPEPRPRDVRRPCITAGVKNERIPA